MINLNLAKNAKALSPPHNTVLVSFCWFFAQYLLFSLFLEKVQGLCPGNTPSLRTSIRKPCILNPEPLSLYPIKIRKTTRWVVYKYRRI